MKKKFTFLMTAMALIFAIIGPRSVAWGQTRENQTLTFDLSSNPGGWPTSNSTTLTEYTYTLNDVDYTFALKNVKCNSGYLMLTSTAVLGLPAIENYKLTKVIASNSGGCSTSTKVGISSSSSSASYISGGEIQTWSTTSSSYTYNLSETEANTMYYMYVTNKNAQVVQLTLTYESTSASTDPSITVNPTTITWNDSPINAELSETISVSQANLTSNITITSTIGNVSPSTITVGENATDVTLTYTPTSVGDFEGEITFTSGATTETVTVSGSAFDPSQVETFEKFTGNLEEGDYVIYYSSYAMKNTVASNRLQNLSVTPDNNAITNPDAAIVWHIAPSGNYWTIYSEDINKYAAGTTSKNQATLIDNITDYAKWTVSTSNGKYEFVNLGRANGTSDPGNKYLRNNDTNGWACYASATGGALTLYKKAENKAATPTLTESQIFTTKPFEVTITNNEAGATVYYTTNGDDPTTETTTNFTGASTTININATTTVKAMAVVEGKANSEIASATYTEQKNDPENQWSAEAYTATIGGENTFPTFSTQSDGAVTYTSSNTNAATIDNTGVITLVAVGTTTITASTAETDTYMAGDASYTLTVKEAPLATMDAIFAKATAVGSTATNVDVTFNNWVISGVKNSNAYLTDNNGEGLIIYTSNHGFEVGNILSGTVACKVQLYNGSAELTNLTATTSGLTVTEGGTVTPVEMNIADLGGVNTGAVITLNNVRYSGSDMFTDGENEIKAYNAFMTLPSFTSGRQYNITGVYIQYGGTKEIAPRDENDIKEIIPTEPSITVAEALELPYTESEETLEVIYQNIDFDNIDINLYDDAECTTDFTGDWFIAEFDDQFNIEYLAEENEESTLRTVYIEIYAIGTDGENDITKVITVTQEAAPQTYNVTLSSNGVVGEPQPVQGSITLSDPTNIPTGFTFAGWTESESNIQFVANPYTPTSVVTLYAVFSRIEGGSGETTWNLVTNSSEIVAGKVIKIAATVSGSSTTTYNGTFAANGTISNSIMGKVSATISDNKLTNDEGAAEFTIGGTSGNWTLTYGGNLLGATDVKKLIYDGGTTTWSISIGEDAKASIANGTNSYGTILYNRDSPRFTTYTSTPTASMVLPQIFVKTVSGTTHYYTRVYDANTELAKLTVNGPSIIMNGYTLTVTGSMSNTNPANLIIEDGAQLIVNNSVQATVKKNIAEATTRDSKWSDWYTISSPLANSVKFAEVENLIPTTVVDTVYDLYRLNEAEGKWENSRVNEGEAFTTIDKGRGYLYARKDKAQLAFAGEINVADVECTLTIGAANGFNLIGNPFTQNIELANVTGVTLAEGFYVLNNDNTWGTKLTDREIKPLQGFLVQATEEGGTARISKNASVRGERSKEQSTNIEMIVSNSNHRDNAFAVFGEGIGLNKVNHRNTEAPMLYVPQDGEKFAIAFMDENTTVFPLNFKAMTTGKYSISLKATDDINTLVLVDNMTGEETNMLLENSYSFNGSPADSDGRFTVKLSISHSNGQSDNEHFVYQNGSELVVNGEGTLQIFDVLGRVVISEEVHGQTVYVGNLSEGAYIVRMTGNEIKTQKIIIR